MATNLLLEGDDPEALLERAQAEGGPRARIVRLGKVRQGGVMGFFAKERYEVAVEIPDDDLSEVAPRPSNDTLLSSLGERTPTPFERQMADREDAERRMNLPSQRPTPQPERLRPAYGPAAPQISAPRTGLPGPVEAVAAIPPRAASVAPIGAVTATPPQSAPSYADVQDKILNRRQDDDGHAQDAADPDEAPALARRGLLDIVDRVNAVERAATRAVAGQPLGEPEGVQFTLPLPRPTSGSPSVEYSRQHEHEQIAASAAFAAGYARAHTGTVEDFMTDDVAALAALRQRPFEMATFPVAAALGQPLAPAPLPPEAAADVAESAAEPAAAAIAEPEAATAADTAGETAADAATEAAPEPVVTTIDDLTVSVDTPSTRRQNTPWDDSDDLEADSGPMADLATQPVDTIPAVDTTRPLDSIPAVDTTAPLDTVPAVDAAPSPTLMRTESIEAEAAAAVRHAADQAADQARAEAEADLARRQAELEATVQAQVRALAGAQIAQAENARHEAEQLARRAVEAAENARAEAAAEAATRRAEVEAAAQVQARSLAAVQIAQAENARHEAEQLARQAVEAAERTAREALQTAERLTGEARESAAEQSRSMADLIAQREQAAAAAAVRAERERTNRDAARYWPGQGRPALGNPMRQPLPVSRVTGPELVDPLTGEAQPPAFNDSQVLQDRSRLRDLGVPVAWTRRLRGGDRLSSVLRILEGLPQSDLDRSTPVVAVVGPTGAAQFEAHRLALDLHVGNQPRPVVVVPARGAGRVAAMATVHRLETCVVAIECQDHDDLDAVLEALEVVEPSAVVAMVDAGAPVAATQEWLDALQTVDLLTVDGAVDAAQPAAVLRLGLPVLRLDGTVVDRTAWAALLTARLEAADDAETPER